MNKTPRTKIHTKKFNLKFGAFPINSQGFNSKKKYNFRDDPLGNRDDKKSFFYLKIIDIKVKLHARNFVKISRVDIHVNRLGLLKFGI